MTRMIRVGVYGDVRSILRGLEDSILLAPIHAPDCERCGVRPATRSAYHGTEYCQACFYALLRSDCTIMRAG